MSTASVKLGFFGGSFDPPHLGHLIHALDVVEQAGLDRLSFLPAGHSPLKANAPVASPEARLAMLAAMVADQPKLEVLDLEMRREGLSYTVDTMAALAELEPEAQRFWVVGADQWNQLDRWHRTEDLVRQVEFIVLRRPGDTVAETPPVPGARGHFLTSRVLDISSTEVRDRLRRGLAVDFLVPPGVNDVIGQRQLYVAPPSS